MKLSRIDLIGQNGNDGTHYTKQSGEHYMKKKFKFTELEQAIIDAAVMAVLREVQEEENEDKLARNVIKCLTAMYRKPRTKKPDPAQLKFEDKLLMEDTMRGPDVKGNR